MKVSKPLDSIDEEPEDDNDEGNWEDSDEF